jgi:predicted TIM-barrel fold metal-dependent hydrolase
MPPVMPPVIDFHTHAFPDSIAKVAIPSLEHEGNIKAALDGTLHSLVASMDQAGIAQSVLCSIATRPEQFSPILEWSKAIRSERIIPFPSLHPADPQILEHLEMLHQEGFKGVKMHPYYQNYYLDDPNLDELYVQLSELGIILVIHAGYDMAFPRIRRGDPERIRRTCQRFPDLKMIATHLGGWEDWEDVQRLLLGAPIYMELSFAMEGLGPHRLREMLLAHPRDYLLFGTDSPWTDQATNLQRLADLKLPAPLFEQIVSGNAHRLLTE